MRTITHILPLISSSLLVAGDSEEIKIDGLKTSPDLDHALSLAKSKKKPILVVFQQEDCEWCELLVDKVLSNPEVQKELNKRFIVTFVDMNENYKLADEYKILGTPTEVFLDYEGNEIDRIQGYEREDKFMTKLKEI
ncbi:MAG: thioredoxin family protein [Methanobrevibacter sp.]|jgi:thioredoxin-related protein|nr:thioredoxin family protein [Methanobrevibacter sp.]MEE3444387.1 thioredoxin family protein [Methanobrevibacter sp.]